LEHIFRKKLIRKGVNLYSEEQLMLEIEKLRFFRNLACMREASSIQNFDWETSWKGPLGK
jgi:hypothetical protein